MLEKIVGAAVKELPVSSQMTEELFSTLSTVVRANTFTELKMGDRIVRVLSGERGPVMEIPGLSALYQSPKSIKLATSDGGGLVIHDKGLAFSFGDGTYVSQFGQRTETMLPNKQIVVQEKLGNDQIAVSTGPGWRMNAIPISSERVQLGGGIYVEHPSATKSSLVFPDGSSVHNSEYGFDISRVIGGIEGSVKHPDITILNNYFGGREPVLQLHDRGIDSMYRSMFVNGSSVKGLQLRVGESWRNVDELIP